MFVRQHPAESHALRDWLLCQEKQARLHAVHCSAVQALKDLQHLLIWQNWSLLQHDLILYQDMELYDGLKFEYLL